jgi:hypothetical protein
MKKIHFEGCMFKKMAEKFSVSKKNMKIIQFEGCMFQKKFMKATWR